MSYHGTQPRYGRVDKFQADVFEIWRGEFGFSVFDLSGSGKGIADALVGVPGNDPRNELCEVKTGNASSTRAQVKFHGTWKGPPVWIIRSPARARQWGREQVKLQELHAPIAGGAADDVMPF